MFNPFYLMGMLYRYLVFSKGRKGIWSVLGCHLDKKKNSPLRFVSMVFMSWFCILVALLTILVFDWDAAPKSFLHLPPSTVVLASRGGGFSPCWTSKVSVGLETELLLSMHILSKVMQSVLKISLLDCLLSPYQPNKTLQSSIWRRSMEEIRVVCVKYE